MKTDLIIAGFGGQGVLFAGQLLAHAALNAELYTTWYPSYGPEMRGGTANCTVVISDEPIGSPVVARPEAAIVLNLPSLDRYEPLVRPGGAADRQRLADRPRRAPSDIDAIAIPADDVAAELGSPRLTNMVLLGALLARLPVFTLDHVAKTLGAVLPERHRHLLPANRAALERGFELARRGEGRGGGRLSADTTLSF
jgi:2-oxoglutarate ferredoxin oxidoreductase subunit gamma